MAQLGVVEAEECSHQLAEDDVVLRIRTTSLAELREDLATMSVISAAAWRLVQDSRLTAVEILEGTRLLLAVALPALATSSTLC